MMNVDKKRGEAELSIVFQNSLYVCKLDLMIINTMLSSDLSAAYNII